MIRQLISAIKLKENTAIKKMEAANLLEKLLKQIDFSSEVVPIDDFEKLKILFTSLKQCELNSEELKLIDEITKPIKIIH